jgi:hypothetical protein
MSESKHPMIDPTACKDLKEKHDVCFYKWYSEKFLKGTVTIECKEEWDEYEFCMQVRTVWRGTVLRDCCDYGVACGEWACRVVSWWYECVWCVSYVLISLPSSRLPIFIRKN